MLKRKKLKVAKLTKLEMPPIDPDQPAVTERQQAVLDAMVVSGSARRMGSTAICTP